MPLTRLAADAFGVVTICLVFLSVLFGLLCIFYSVYFRSRIRTRGYVQLGYFNGPWIIRITLILIAIWWGIGEIVRLSLLRGKERVLHSLSSTWQENICKFYILSNLGFAEPSMFLTLIFLLQASLQRRELGTLSRQWNKKTFGYVLLFCFPIFILQLGLVLIGPKLTNKHAYFRKMPKYFTLTSIPSNYVNIEAALCTYPLLSTIVFGLFSSLLIAYFLYLGARMLSSVINKGLRRRVYVLIISVIVFLPLRVLFLGFSSLSHPGHLPFESLVFLAFLALLCCALVGICVLVYCPIADSLAVSSHQHLEMGGELFDANDSSSPIANQSLIEVASVPMSPGRNSDASMKGGSMSFRLMIRDESLSEGFEEVNLLSSGARHFASPPDSPPLPGRPMIPLREVSNY
ncbi:hypothetical protein AAC387_Pa01g0417 [Persea americana]